MRSVQTATVVALTGVLLVSGSVLGAEAAGTRPEISLTLVPPSPVTDQIVLDIRGAVWNVADSAKTCEVSFFLDEERPENRLHHQRIVLPPEAPAGVKFLWPTKSRAGLHDIIMVARCDDKVRRFQRRIEIMASDVRSTRRLGGAWVDIYHHDEKEGKPFNADLGKMTDRNWRELVRAMHDVDQDVLVITMMFQNFTHRGQHKIPTEGYHGKAYYPSKLFPGRMPIASEDPLETILDEADRLGMHVMPGVGCYAFFDYTPEALDWHKKVADELWERYGHHPSFYGWYVSGEKDGSLGNEDERREIADFFREFTPYVRRLAPDKPVMLATNCYNLRGAEAAYRKLLPHLDILCPFAFHRMNEGDLTGEEAAALLQSLCDEAGCHLWMDLESFVFRNGVELHPRPIDGFVSDFTRFPNFEKTLHYQFPGLLSGPKMSLQPGGSASVQLYDDYRRYLESQTKGDFSSTRPSPLPSQPASAPAASAIRPIRGTWLNLFHQDARNDYMNPTGVDFSSPELWRTKIKEMWEMGIRYLIFLAVANEGKAMYESHFMPPAYPAGKESPVSAIMKAADRHGMKVFLSCGWARNQDDQPGQPEVRELQLKIMRECADRFSRHPSFVGWYLPCEDYLAPHLGDHAIRSVNALAAEARRYTPGAKILISPYGLHGAVVDDQFVAQLAKLDVDIIAYQDEVGCVRVPCPLVTMRRNFARLRSVHDDLPRIALWANVESFTWERQANSRDSALTPAAFPRLLSQMAAVSAHADEVVSFIVQGMIDKPGSPVPVGQPVYSEKLARDYMDFLMGKGRWPMLGDSFTGNLSHDAVGRPASLSAMPSSKYAKGNLTDGRFGEEDMSSPDWLGFEKCDIVATVDLGESRPISTLTSRFLQFAPAGIRLPSRVDFAVSDDGREFRRIASVVSENWPNDRHDYWIDMALADELNTRGRFVRMHAVNTGGWLFADELLVNPRARK
ncbi:MAG TPA: DUF4434 domain-containing protein [Phycisphaerae bacterium]|nr:DUF4434 domain-containing protein [Phycisphaerae bacterium]